MPKKVVDSLLTKVKAELAYYPYGAPIESLLQVLGETVSRRTLQRRLAAWVRGGDLKAAGKLKGRRYFLPNAAHSGQVREPEAPQSWYVERYAQWAARQASMNIGSFSFSQSIPYTQLDGPIQISSSYPMGRPVSYAVREPVFEGYISLSPDAAEVRQLIQRPANVRTPVGYRREFLDAYVPNETPYLPEKVRQYLHETGHTPASQRPAGSYARELLNRLLIDLSWASSRMEGNSYSLLDTQRLIETGAAAPGKDSKETQMILNHKAAIEMLVDAAEDIAVDRYTLLSLHALLSEGLLADRRAIGALRNAVVSIGASMYTPTAIPQLIDECFHTILEKGVAIEDPFEQSFFLMVHLPYLQPFLDVNKRTSRLAANVPLIKHNLVPLSFVEVPEQAYIDGTLAVYELNRVELLRDVYVWTYERSCLRYKTLRESIPAPDPFRMRHRAALTDVIQSIVLRQVAPDDATGIEQLAVAVVPPEDVERFVQLVIDELAYLHEGNIVRFRLPLAKFQEWRRSYPV